MWAVEVEAAIRVLRVSGEVKCAPVAKGPFEKLEVGKVFKAPRFFRTGTNSFLDLELDGGSLVRVTAESDVSVDKSVIEKGVCEIQIDVPKGRAVFVANFHEAESKFEVKSPEGVCGARPKDADTPAEFDAAAGGEIRCVQPTLVVVYVNDGVLDGGGILGAEQKFIPTKPVVSLKTIEPGELNNLKKELADLKSSKGK